MTRSEMHLHDTAFIGPALLFLDQYFNSFIDEYIVLWIALVSISLAMKSLFVYPFFSNVHSFATANLRTYIFYSFSHAEQKPKLS